MDKPQRVTTENQAATPTKVYSCKEKILYTVCDSKILQLDKKDLNQIDKCKDINRLQKCHSGKPFVAVNMGSEESGNKIGSKKRLTLEEIKNIPRFKDYEAGEPSQVIVL